MKTREASGPLEAVFSNAIARVLDQASIVGNMDQTTAMLVESTELDFKSVQLAVARLVEHGLMEPTKKIGHAQAYAFDMDKLRWLAYWVTNGGWWL
nr:hypothetical protein [Ferrimicrobium acidiphilum]